MSSSPRGHLIRRIERLGQLPTLPRVAAEVMEAMRDPNASMARMAEVISCDPALTAKVLRVANSAFYGVRELVGSLQLALSILGMREINSLVLSLAVFRVFPKGRGETDYDLDLFWSHSAVTGQISRALCRRLKLPGGEEAFVAGLLHDIGRIVFVEYCHDEFMQAVSLASAEGVSMTEAEQSVIGLSHADLGGELAGRWRLPGVIVCGIQYHHHPDSCPEADRLMPAVVGLSDLMCHAKGIGHAGEACVSVLAETQAWEILTRKRPELADMDLERLTFEMDDEIAKALELVTIATGAEDEQESRACTAP